VDRLLADSDQGAVDEMRADRLAEMMGAALLAGEPSNVAELLARSIVERQQAQAADDQATRASLDEVNTGDDVADGVARHEIRVQALLRRIDRQRG
jgi:hypothetical protein